MKRKLIPTDFTDPSTGEPLYVTMRKPRRWRYLLAEIRLFCGIVWRRWEDGRMDWRTAWEIAFGNSLYHSAKRAWEAR